MSEDDIDTLAVDGQGSQARVDRDRRAPRFSWTPAYEATFFRSLCESVQLGLRENSSFKAEAWDRAAAALRATHGAYPAKSHLINKSDNARKRFRLWRGLREDPEFLYNPQMRTVTATEEAWRAHIEREPLSRALRGRPFDHEDFMEILYPDVIGSGGAPKRIMKPRRKTDGTVDDSEMPGTSVINLQGSSQPSLASPSQQARPSLSQTPSGSSNGSLAPGQMQQAAIPSTLLPTPVNAATNSSALTPPDDSLPQNQNQLRKRRLGMAGNINESSESPGEAALVSTSSSPQKRRRTSSRGTSLPGSGPLLPASAIPGSSRDAPASVLQTSLLDELLDALKSRAAPRWREQALDIFFKDFCTEELDLQVKISENILMSYADVAASGPKQTPEEAAAPQPPQIITDETASTASLVDVDTPSVRTVPSDFAEQEIQTETQAQRIEREAEVKKVKAKREVRKADSWLTEQFSKLSDGSAGALAVANLAGIVGLSAFLGYKGWGLYERGRLSWENVGLGVGILAAVGVVEGTVGRYLYKGKKEGSS